MARKMIDMVGQRFGRLLVVERVENRKTVAAWRCVCDCGTPVVRTGGGLRLGQSLSCGCLRKEKLIARNVASSDGQARHPLHETWRSMIRRCSEPAHNSFKNYGAVGVNVCSRWRESFAAFLEDMGPCPDGKTLDRYPNGSGNYEPGNCRWADAIAQNNNRKNVALLEFRGELLSVAQACRITGMRYDTVKQRVDRGWTLDRAATAPVRETRKSV
jgi:hypothetical protein